MLLCVCSRDKRRLLLSGTGKYEVLSADGFVLQ